MTCFVLQWRDYLKDLKADSFDDPMDAIGFHGKLDFDPQVQSTFLILDEMSCRSPLMSASMRHDIYEIFLPDGMELPSDRKISAEELVLRLDIWMKS